MISWLVVGTVQSLYNVMFGVYTNGQYEQQIVLLRKYFTKESYENDHECI